ncbi:MAG: hypothetical protein WBH55_11890 [Bacteroidota bacterium]
MRNAKLTAAIPLSLAVLSTVGVLAIVGSGCGTTRTTSPLTERLDSAGISLYTLQIRNQDFAGRSASIVEAAANNIMRLSSDAEVKESALAWKMYAIPQLRGALLFSDPLAAQFDTWIFCGQLLEYFEKGGGKENFDSLQPIAINASRQLSSEASNLMRGSLSEYDFTRLDSLVAVLVSNNPIENDLYLRKSAVDALSATLGKREYSVQSAIGRMARDLEDISGMIPIYAEQLPREARWHAEYILAEHDLDGRVDSIQGQIVEITAAIHEITNQLDRGDLEINVGKIRNLQEYINTLEKLVEQQRSIIMEEIDRIRLETMQSVEAYADAKIDQATSHIYDIVDYVLLRVAILLGIALILAIAAFLLLRRRGRSGPAAQ